MAGLVLTPQGCYKIPECEKCHERMRPQNYQRLDDDIWKCHKCNQIKMREKNESV